MLPLSRCQFEPRLRTLRTLVLSCSPTPSGAPESSYDSQEKKKSSKKLMTYDIVLEETVLFPEGGDNPRIQ
eukprot:g1402.t1